MSYCQSQQFSPTSFIQSQPDETTLISLVYASQGLFVLLALYIIFKMCKLCSKAFSYSNFHIHENYKFYTLALISTIMVLVSRTVQLEFASKISYAKLHPDDETPFRKNPYYQGWIIFNELTGTLSIYTVNLMYGLAALTWLMIANQCDFNSREEMEKMDQEEEERRGRLRKFYVRLRIGLLYGFVPVAMVVAVCAQLHYSRGWCLTAKILTCFTNTLVYLLFLYSLANILLRRLHDPQTPLQTKLFWSYLILASTTRQCASWILAIQDFVYPSQCDYVPIKGQINVVSNVMVFLYGVFVTTVPIFLLGLLADKRLEIQRGSVSGSGGEERIVYSSTII